MKLCVQLQYMARGRIKSGSCHCHDVSESHIHSHTSNRKFCTSAQKKHFLTLSYEVNPIHICTWHHCCLTHHAQVVQQIQLYWSFYFFCSQKPEVGSYIAIVVQQHVGKLCRMSFAVDSRLLAGVSHTSPRTLANESIQRATQCATSQTTSKDSNSDGRQTKNTNTFLRSYSFLSQCHLTSDVLKHKLC